MKNNTETKIWNATLYLRLSRDDGDKEESNSITGQRELLRDFIRNRPELREYAVRIDDGFTGSNFERPDFKKMMEDVKEGRTNCIIVKDLSRFGRNYLDAGEYIEKIFPFLGVRFIAVNDNYDSFGEKNASDELVIPFKNLINEAYCRDISVKVRTQLEVKRKSGQYIGAFAVYGYLKDETDKNHLIVDEYAADMTLKRRYKAEAEEAERLIEALTRRQAAEAAHTPENPFLAAFGSFRGADVLTKEMAQALIERVYVDGDSNIEIVFRYRDEYKELCTYLEGRKTDA